MASTAAPSRALDCTNTCARRAPVRGVLRGRCRRSLQFRGVARELAEEAWGRRRLWVWFPRSIGFRFPDNTGFVVWCSSDRVASVVCLLMRRPIPFLGAVSSLTAPYGAVDTICWTSVVLPPTPLSVHPAASSPRFVHPIGGGPPCCRRRLLLLSKPPPLAFGNAAWQIAAHLPVFAVIVPSAAASSSTVGVVLFSLAERPPPNRYPFRAIGTPILR